MPTRRAARKTTTEKGLGWAHQQAVARLLRKHVDGGLCWWCGLPMFKDRHRNWDGKTLAGDHTVPRVAGGQLADRLLHGMCNSQRQDGRYDDVRPTVIGCHPREWLQRMRDMGRIGAAASVPIIEADAELAMDW